MKIALITDSISATMLPDGRYKLGGLDVEVKNGIPRIAGTNTLAGSTLTMDKAVKNLVEKGVLLKNAITMATLTPAKSIGADKTMKIGELKPGYKGDIVILDKNTHDVKYTIVEGNIVYRK